MPGGDRTGPRGQGPFTGRGLGNPQGGMGIGRGRGIRRSGGLGPRGDCVCPSCGTSSPHRVGFPCNKMTCPNCGELMIRK